MGRKPFVVLLLFIALNIYSKPNTATFKKKCGAVLYVSVILIFTEEISDRKGLITLLPQYFLLFIFLVLLPTYHEDFFSREREEWSFFFLILDFSFIVSLWYVKIC